MNPHSTTCYYQAPLKGGCTHSHTDNDRHRLIAVVLLSHRTSRYQPLSFVPHSAPPPPPPGGWRLAVGGWLRLA